MHAVVLAGGLDHRMKSLARTRPKTLLRIMGRSLAEHVIQGLVEAGVNNVVVVVDSGEGYMYLGDAARRLGVDARVRAVMQRGGGVVEAAVTGLKSLARDEDIILAYGDILAEPSMYRGLVEHHLARGSEVTVAAVPMGHALETYGVFKLGENGLIEGFERGGKNSTYVFGGALMSRPSILLEAFGNPGPRGVFGRLVEGREASAYVWRGLWHDVDTPWDLLLASASLLRSLDKSMVSCGARVSENATLEGPVYVEEDARIDHGAVVRGPAYIGRGALIGVGSFIREYTDAEEHSIIGAHSEVKRTVLQPHAYLGSHTYVTDSVVGRAATISPYTLTLNTPTSKEVPPRLRGIPSMLEGGEKLGSIIGEDARIGAHTILYPGASILPGSTVKPGSIISGGRDYA